jgi:hypothetical protein
LHHACANDGRILKADLCAFVHASNSGTAEMPPIFKTGLSGSLAVVARVARGAAKADALAGAQAIIAS